MGACLIIVIVSSKKLTWLSYLTKKSRSFKIVFLGAPVHSRQTFIDRPNYLIMINTITGPHVCYSAYETEASVMNSSVPHTYIGVHHAHSDQTMCFNTHATMTSAWPTFTD